MTDDKRTQLEKTLDLPSVVDIENIKNALAEQAEKIENTQDMYDSAAQELDEATINAVAVVNEREHRIKEIVDLKEYDKDNDEIFNETMKAFKDTISVAMDVPAAAAGKIYEAAANFAKIALEAKNSKIKAKLDAIDLSIKKQRVELANKAKTAIQDESEINETAGVVMDRNELIKDIVSQINKNNK